MYLLQKSLHRSCTFSSSSRWILRTWRKQHEDQDRVKAIHLYGPDHEVIDLLVLCEECLLVPLLVLYKRLDVLDREGEEWPGTGKLQLVEGLSIEDRI